MHLSSDSSVFFKSNDRFGWRFHLDLSKYNYVRMTSLNIFFGDRKLMHTSAMIFKIYSNLVEKSLTDPFGTLAVTGGLFIKNQPGKIIILN